MDVRCSHGLERISRDVKQIISEVNERRAFAGFGIVEPNIYVTWHEHHENAITIPTLELGLQSDERETLLGYFRAASETIGLQENEAYRLICEPKYGSIKDLTSDPALLTLAKAGSHALMRFDDRAAIDAMDFSVLSEAWTHDSSPYAIAFREDVSSFELAMQSAAGFEELFIDHANHIGLEGTKRESIRHMRTALVGASIGSPPQTFEPLSADDVPSAQRNLEWIVSILRIDDLDDPHAGPFYEAADRLQKTSETYVERAHTTIARAIESRNNWLRYADTHARNADEWLEMVDYSKYAPSQSITTGPSSPKGRFSTI